MPRTHRRSAARKRGGYLNAHQGELAFAHDNRAFFNPTGPGGSLIANRLVERDPTNGKAIGRYSPNGTEFTCPECGHVYTADWLELEFWHRIVAMTGELFMRCRYCPSHTPILRIYQHPGGQSWIELASPGVIEAC